MAERVMTYWSLLGIDPTADESVIKKAYASQLQVYHPEEDPEGYQRLREAYEWAKKRAKALQAEATSCGMDEDEWHCDTYDIDDPDDEISVLQSSWQAADSESSPLKRHPAQVFFEQMEELYDDFPRRIDPEQWKILMASDYMWDMDHQRERLSGLLRFLEKHRHFPRKVWDILNQSFYLLEQKEDLFELYDEEEIAFIIGQIQGTAELGYACFEERQLNFDIEHYLTLRQDAQTLLMEDNPVAARDDLAEAYDLFQHDPDLQLLQAKCYLRLGQHSEAKLCLQQVLKLKPDEHEARLLLAHFLYKEQHYDEAIGECKLLEEQGVLNQDVMSIYGNSAIELGRIEQAWKKYSETEPIWQKFYHFQYNLMLLRMRNRHLFNQEHNPRHAEYKKRVRKSQMWSYGMLMFRLSWLYLFLFLLVYFIFGLPPVFLIVLPIILCRSAWKTLRTARMFIT
ncbi:tetratricopeptide repeat protein [Paenibacillus lentus]|uniref:Tetratricopeptide repeat protein n=2 Tax=Paenibacillus lentus TaxID=1338368 RepID=A0A3Q8SE08_9BACL|nr:tetratricopeptide repeat protein [Paenibacillus lentus]